MGTSDQLKLLLWKDFLVRRRHLGVATLVFGWAIGVFLILYIVRESVDLEYSPSCQYTARSLPSTGLFPFVQSFICNVDNKCNNISSYEEVPQYKNARLTSLAKQLETAFTNDSVLSVVKSLPDMIILLKAVGYGLDSPDLEGIFGSGVKINQLFDNPRSLKRELQQGNPNLDVEIIDELFDSSLKVGPLMKSFGSSDMASSICKPDELEKYLILENPDKINEVSSNLCSISGEKVPSLIQNIFDHANFTGLLQKIGNTVDHFTNYNVFEDLRNLVKVFLGLNFMKENVPSKLKLEEWLPNVVYEMKELNRTYFDKKFIYKALEIIEPHFNNEKVWANYKNLIVNIAELLSSFQDKIISKGPLTSAITSSSANNFSSFVSQLQNDIEKMSNPSQKDILEQQETVIKILNDTLNILPVFYFNSSKPWTHAANIMDSLIPIVENKYLNQISTIAFIYSKGITALHNTLKHEYGSEKIMYSLCEKHSNVVSTLFSLGPEFITNMIHCFGNVTCTSIIVANKNDISQLFCDQETVEKILPDASSIKNIEMLCNFDMNPLIDDLISNFNLDWINTTVIDMENRLKNNKINNDSFISAVENTEKLMEFVRSKREDNTDISWEQLFPDFENTEWSHIANEAKRHSGLYIVNVQLSFLKETIKDKRSLNQYLNASSLLMEGFLTEYNLLPKSLIETVLLHFPSVVDTIIKTFTNKTQIMTLISLDDWEQYFCNSSDKNFETTAKIVCEKISFLNMLGNRRWYTHPFFTAIYNTIYGFYDLNVLNWDQFTTNAQNLYLTIKEILNMKISNENWDKLEVFQSKFWLNWIENLDIDTQIRFSIQLITKIGDLIETNYLDNETKTKWNQIQGITTPANQFITFVLDLIDFAISSEKNAPEISTLYPATYNLSQIVIQNFDVLIMDMAKVVDDPNIDFAELSEWFEYPCTKIISEILPNFSAQSMYTLIKIQEAICNSTLYEDEWRIAGIESSQNKSSNVHGHELQLTVSRFSNILHEIRKLNPDDDTNFKLGSLQQIEENLNLAHKETNFEKIIFKIVDKMLDTTVMRQETLQDLFKKLSTCKNDNEDCKEIELDTTRYTTKLISTSLYEIIVKIQDYMQLINSTEGVDPLRLIGFKNNSAIYTLYLKFPEFVKVFVHSYRSAEFEDKILEKRSKGENVFCNEIVGNLIIPENNTVTKKDINALRRYLCPSYFDWPILQDNIFLSTVTRLQDLYMDTPISKLNISYVTFSNSLFDLKTDILSMTQYGNINIKQIWNEIWTKEVEKTFEEIKNMKFTSNNTITRYFKYIDLPEDVSGITKNLINPKYGFGDFEFFLEKISTSLNSFSDLNVNSSDISQEDIEEIQNLISFHSKDIKSLLSYLYFKYPSDDFWTKFDKFCTTIKDHLKYNRFMYPMWIKKYENTITQKMCNITDENIRRKIIQQKDLLDIKNYNVNLEDILIQFLTTLQNFVKNNSTIHLSDTLKNNFDLQKILNHTFPTEEELRNASTDRANQFPDRRSYIVDIDEKLQISTLLVKFLQGGNWWDTLMSNVHEPSIKIWLYILEHAPTILIHLSEAAISPHFLYEITSTLVTRGPLYLCSPDFNIQRYLRDDNLVSIIKTSCHAKNERSMEIYDVYVNETDVYYTYHKEKMAEHIYDFEKSLVDLVKQGPKKFDLPKWMNESDIQLQYKEYAKRNSQPLKLLQIVTTVITEVIDIGSVFYKNQTEHCSWCNWATMLVREANQQLSNSQKYVDFMCNAPNMNFTQIKNTLLNDFKWGEFFKDIANNKSYSVKDFDTELHDSIDVIRLQLITFYTNKTLQGLSDKCMKQIGDAPGLKNISTYISAVRELTNILKQSNTQILQSPIFADISSYFSNILDLYVPILKPLSSVLKEGNTLRKDMKNLAIEDFAISELLESKIDVNTLSQINNSEIMEKYFENKDYFNKLLSFDNYSYAQEIQNEIRIVNKRDLAKIFYESIDEDKLNLKIPKWREETMKNFDWVTNILDKLEKVIFNGGNILEFVSNVDFSEFKTGNINISSLLKGVLELLEKHSIEKFFQSLRELVIGLSPIIQDEKIENDLLVLINGVENMTIFKSLGLLRIKHKISDMVQNWKDVKKYLTQEIKLEEDVVDNILNASIDISAIISSQGDSMNIRSMICDPNELSRIINFNVLHSEQVAENVSKVLCNLTMGEIQKIATVTFKHVNFSQVMSSLMDTTVDNILTSANMSEAEGEEVVKNIGIGIDLLPYLKSMMANISDDISILPKFDALKSEDTGTKSFAVSPDLLASASTLLCGRPLVQRSNKLYKTISEAKDFNAENYDKMEQKSLPTDFCRNVYKDVVNMEIGKVIWAYIKPLLRGQILYTPNTLAVRKILANANSTFANIAELQDILYKITDSLTALEDKEEMEHILGNVQKFLNSSVVQIAVQGVIKQVTNSNFSLSNLDLKSMLNSFGDSKGISSALKFGTNILHCVLLNRFTGVDTEEELEVKAKALMQTNEFIAGIVFLNMESRPKRSIDLPKEISYKIRMDVDSVPSTSYMKYKFWTPGPESDFLDELRYFRGFIQLQDLIDNAIISLKGYENMPKWETLTQEMPYPCWIKDFFKSALAISQTFQVCFFFGLIAVVAASVRYVVWEKESGNTMVMNVMGLRYITHCTSWFIVTFVEMLFATIAIFIILKAGGILPLTNGFLLFLYILEFGFSVIMFCYMISSIFNSASLAAVGSAIFYLLSFMPYIIIISLETTLEFWSKMFTNLSMSTSFCYGCLYMIRYELQGVGLQWDNTWETPIPGDSMNFGMTCVFLLLDGILYGLIGYFCSRKSQGENYLDGTISSTNIVNDEPLKIGVTIKGLTKVYNSRKKTVKAIEDIDITLYTGQVTTLLGHNGAGKTTLIKILTGMMQPTSGQIIINSEIKENEKDKNRFLGVCPQGSVLINTMTPLEHLIFYAKLKTQRSTEEVMPEVMDMIDSMSLGSLSNEPVSHLSEGMRRRICVAIAFIGKPKLVVLDEPSSGVDPVARRQIWDLVIRYKEGCTVLLTTHYLDEAELLSDRVVVLHKGKVLCSGSPLVLRQSYGSGYKITVTYPEENEHHQLNDTAVDAIVSLVKETASNAFLSEIRGFTLDITVPFTSSDGVPNNFEKVTLCLEENQHNLGFTNFNINCATLEQVFLDLCEQADAKESGVKNIDTISQLGKSYSTVFSSSIEELTTSKDDVLINTGEKLTGGTTKKFFALLKKRAIHYSLDWRIVVCALVLPTLFTAVAMGFSLIRPPNSNEPALKLTPDLYKEHTTHFISVETSDLNSFVNNVSREILHQFPQKNWDIYTKSSRNCECKNGMQTCAKSSKPVYDSLLKINTAKETQEWILETFNDHIEGRYGGWSLSDQVLPNKSAMIVWYNNKGYHSMPSYLNTMNSAMLRTISPGSSITTYNHPLKLSLEQLSKSSIAQHIADVGIAMVLLIAFSLVPASGSIYLVQERVNEEKRMQFLCGVSPTLYWIVAFVWDMIILLCALCLAVIVFRIFGLPVYVARDNMAAVTLLIFLYGWACIPFIHLAQRLFNDASMANMILFCVCTFIGIGELTCLLLMDILGKTQFVADFRDVLHKIYLLFPQFVLGDGLVEISKNNIQSEILKRFHMDTYVSPLSWDLMGLHYLSLAIVGTILFLVNLIIENEWFKMSKKTSTTVHPTETECLEIVNLTKVYNTVSGKHAAVNDISLQVPFGECLGLIGVNGAGKSTTFKMLTTELRPTSGRIFIQGREICRKPLYTGEMGYCPQCDSLDPKLTVKQTLQLYLTLRGVDNRNEILNKVLFKFELSNYANRRNENLSGGNKRKLCTALSVLGKTSLILMDEPTSGMDPYSRSLVSLTIQQLTKQNRSVILTSHSVEDCEALCSNVAIMINGRVICQGSPQNLKERYGSGYIISVRLAKPTEQDLLLELMKKHFPGAEQMSRQYCSSQYAVPTDKTKISEMFNKMAKISEYASVEDFNLVQSSLDQVFINLANKTEATSINLESKPLPNMYSMDVIV